MTTHDANVVELRALRERLIQNPDLPDAELDRMVNRLAFLREQIDLVRKEQEGSRAAAQRNLAVIQEEVDRERLP